MHVCLRLLHLRCLSNLFCDVYFCRNNNIVGAGTKFRLLSGACTEGRDAAVRLLRQRFRIQQQNSFNSEASSHLTIDRQDFIYI